MAGLQRSEISFRRQGSSGSVWDDKFLAGALNQAKQNDQEEEQKAEAGEAKLSQSPAPISVMERSRSNGGQAYKTVKVAPAIDPPSLGSLAVVSVVFLGNRSSPTTAPNGVSVNHKFLYSTVAQHHLPIR
ncbi:MAPK kinase substrate protein [Vitis vinifera]|uniref:MAPK kinase substrate protein n=1 Tax=Vitis vinifera TaxID=29760 RepID=A0A438EIG3_VITVI|nr:MAPK kinase substrate protein [Vitis vinifera]